MTATTYQHCYRILRTHGDCDLKELRLAYRRRVRHCHPDRLPQDAGASPGRDDEFKQVVRAYRLLVRFHMQHGELPPPYLAVSENATVVAVAARAQESTAPGTRKRKEHRSSWVPSPFHRALVAAFIGGVCVAAAIERFESHGEPGVLSTRQDERDAAESSVPADEPSALGQLAVGMDPQSVVDLQGVPSYTKGSVWFYGDSGVIFDKGCVIGWENQPPFPLRTLVATAYLLGSASGNSRPELNDCVVPN